MAPGHILGKRYIIIKRIGQGATSIVYKAEDTKLKRFVTVKVLKEEFANDEAFIKKFTTEAFAVACLSHINVGMVYDVCEEDNLHYIVMEYIEGYTLKELIEKEAPFSQERTIDYAIQILAGLKAAHEQNIVHRDIKPENIMVTEDGVLKVKDFGMAQIVTSSTITLTGDAVGSVHYFSPEQAKGRPVNKTTDLYAVGIIIFEMITNHLPFESDNHITIAIKHINDPIPKPSQYNSLISKTLEDIIIKATNKVPELRFQSADLMSDALKKALITPDTVIPNLSSKNIILDNPLSSTIYLDKQTTEFIRNQEKNSSPAKKEILGSFTRLTAVFLGMAAAIGVIIGVITSYILFGNHIPDNSSQKMAAVPNLIGRTFEEASAIATEDSFIVTKIGEKESTKVKEGTVLEQIPMVSVPALRNSTINLIIAKKPEDVTVIVPDVINLNNADAQKLLEEVGLYFTLTREYSDYIEIGKVINQTPKGNTKAQQRDMVTIVVSLGKEMPYIIMPSLYDLSLEQAENTLKAYELVLGTVTEKESEKPEGVVIEQDIVPNSNVDPDTVINISVSIGRKNLLEDLDNTLDAPLNDVTRQEIEADIEEILQELDAQDDKDNNNEIITKSYTIKLPETLQDNIENQTYQVTITFQTDVGEQTLFDKIINIDEFPYTLDLTGIGSGILTIYFDSLAWQEEMFSF
ncbi:hypothetical protein AN641_05050 [Candidatus Epulonipiscioides gigas]|nr:hypothetical protein AN641_05050 [Epulopiscium sp. SCG-C07WGA-EpuloA2]